MEIVIAASFCVCVHSKPVNWLPWPLFMIPGLPYLAMASFRASAQKSASMLFDSRQFKALRLCQSMIATRYRNGSFVSSF